MQSSAQKSSYHLSVLLVEDEDTAREEYSKFLGRRFESVFTAANVPDALKIFNSGTIDFIITDIRMEKQSGLELIQYVREKNKKIPIVVLSAWATDPSIARKLRKSVQFVLLKPTDKKLFLNVLTTIAMDIFEDHS